MKELLKEKVLALRKEGLTLRDAIDTTTSDINERQELAKIFAKEFDGNHWD